MANQLFANNATTTTMGHTSVVSTTIIVNSSTGFPSPTGGDWFIATLDGGGNYIEIVKVTAVTGNTWTVVRAQEGTTAKLWQPNSRIECRITAGVAWSMNNISGIVPIANGGTGASTAPTALSNLGALPTAGGTMTGALAISQTAGITGTTTNNNVSAGGIGEYVTNTGSGVSISTSTDTNITSISLTAGDWDVMGTINYQPAGGAIPSQIQGSVNTTSASMASDPDRMILTLSFPANQGQVINVPIQRISLAATTTVYLVGFMVFAGGTTTAQGRIRARRIR